MTQERSRCLTFDEWQEVAPPFYYLRFDEGPKDDAEREMVEKWVHAHCGGWYYFTGKYIIFEREGDRLLARIWLASDPFKESLGEVGA